MATTHKKPMTQTQKQMGNQIMNFEHDMQMQWLDQEELLLSYLMQSGDSPESKKWGGIQEEIYAQVKASDFYGEVHRAIYKVCLTLRKNDIPANTVTLGTAVGELRREDISIATVNLIGKKALDTPYAKPQTLIKAILAGSHVRTAARLILDKYPDMLHGDEEALHAIVDGCAATLDNRGQGIVLSDPAQEMNNDYEEHKKWLRMSPEERDKSRFKTTMPAVDKMCYMRPSDMWILAGDTGAGKTCMATDFARAWTKQGKDVAYFSLEINRKTMENRAICAEGQIPVNAFIKGEEPMTQADWNNADAAEKRLANGHLRFIDNCPTLDSILNTCRVLHAQNKLQIVIVDHLQHVDFDGKKSSGNNRYTNLCDMTMKLKAMAMKYNVLVLALSQFNRAEDNRMEKRPTLRSLRDSGSIEQDADGVLAIFRETKMMDTGDGGRAPLMNKNGELLILKNRMGETGSIPLIFEGEHYGYLYGVKGKEFQSGAVEHVQNAFGREAVPRNAAEYQERELQRMLKATNKVMAREEAERKAREQAQQEQEADEGYLWDEEDDGDDEEG